MFVLCFIPLFVLDSSYWELVQLDYRAGIQITVTLDAPRIQRLQEWGDKE